MCRVAGFSASVSKYVICWSFIYLHSTHSLARLISIYPFNIQSVHTSIRAFPSASCAKSVTGFESLNELTYATKASFSCLDIVNRRAWSDWEGRRVARRSPEQQRIIRKMATSLAGCLLLKRVCQVQTTKGGGIAYVILTKVTGLETRLTNLICDKRDITQPHSHLVHLLAALQIAASLLTS